MMRAIILLGGFGTRLQSVLTDLPKPMAPIQGKPFLSYLLDYLQAQGFDSVIFSVHHLYEKIQSYFGNQYQRMHIEYAIEEKPLGTGGAIAHSLRFLSTEEPVFVLNGDTFLRLDYQKMYEQHLKYMPSLSMALRAVDVVSRYGKVLVENHRVTAFKEKGETGSGFINAGVYLLQPNLFSSFDLPDQFSFETDFLFPHLKTLTPVAFPCHDYFIDIGIPEDLARAQIELSAFRTF
ncbi:MAG TPA: nucleotidyltransferase family protein [Gammaproteobacteria bacterium]|jgi:D-glycero-alpha-D-manno-heptose 1-phosphate guanylyltransferase|nr:nucleotidyltransferase family protein [Gammaproteobacteria bacterium]